MKCPNCGCTLVKVDDNLIHVRFQDTPDGKQNWQLIETLPKSFRVGDIVSVSGYADMGIGSVVWQNAIYRKWFIVKFENGDIREAHINQMRLEG